MCWSEPRRGQRQSFATSATCDKVNGGEVIEHKRNLYEMEDHCGRRDTCERGLFLNDAPAGASVLFQSVPDLTGSVYPSGICSACFGSFQAFDTFSLGSSALIDAVTVSVYPVPFPVDIDLSVWSISSGLPDSELFSETFTPSQFTLVSYPDRTLVTVEPVGLSLLSGTYDISFYNPTGLALKSYYGGSGLLYQEGHGFVQGASLGFTLNGDVR